MYVTQTYLGSLGGDAKLYVYYMFENYDRRQETFTSEVEQLLARLGDKYGSAVTLFMPQRSSADRVEGEIRQLGQLWRTLHGQLPGLLLTPRTLGEFDETKNDSVYVPFLDTNPKSAVETIQKLQEATDYKLYWRPDEKPTGQGRRFGKWLWDAVEVKPGLFGFRVDLKKLA